MIDVEHTLETIASTALVLIERDGLEALNMRSLADELGVNALSLYRTVPSRAALLDAVGEIMIRDSSLSQPHRSQDWREQLADLTASFREVALRYPRAFPLIVTRQTPTPVSLMPIERVLSTLELAGLRGSETVRVERAIISLVMGSLLWEIATTTSLGGEPRLTPPPAVMAQLGAAAPHVLKHAADLAQRDTALEFAYATRTAIAIVEQVLAEQARDDIFGAHSAAQTSI